MTESKYCEVLLNLHATGRNTMKSYYSNSFNTSFEKLRERHTQHFPAPFDSHHRIPRVASPSKYRRYSSSFQAVHTRESISNPTPFPASDRMLAYEQSASKVNRECLLASNTHCRSPSLSDVHNNSQYRHNTSPYYNKASPFNKNSDNGYSHHDNKHERSHIDLNSQNTHHRLKYTSPRNNGDYRTSHHSFYHQKADLDKTQIDSYHKYYENYRSLPTPCLLSCCSTLRNVGNVPENRNYYGHRELSPRPSYSPSVANSTKKHDYPAHVQALSSREPGENSAFSPIRPSHIRRVHSTESGYSSESNGTCHSVNSYKELELSNKCCSAHDHSPTVSHNVCREIASHESLNDQRKRVINDHRDSMTGELRGDHTANELRPHLPYAGFQGIRPGHEVESERIASEEYNNRSEQLRMQTNIESKHHEKVNAERLMNENIKMNDELRERHHREQTNRDLWRTHDTHRESFNVDALSRTIAAKECDVRKDINGESKHWNPAINAWKLPAESTQSKHDVSDEESRAATKAFDAHIRKMITYTCHNSRSNNPTTQSQQSVSQSNYSPNVSMNGNRLFKLTELDGRDIHTVSDKGDPNISQLNHKIPTVDHSKDGKQSPCESSHVNQSKEAENILQSSRRNCADELRDEKYTPAMSNDDNKSPPTKLSHCTQLPDGDHLKDEIVKDMDKLKEEGFDGTATQEGKEKASAQTPELQCPAVDSTLNDDAVIDGGKPHNVSGLLGLTRVANEHLGQALAKEKKRSKNNNCLHLWQFLRRMLDQEQDKLGRCIEWTNRETGEFRLIKTAVIADLWGQSKNRTCMTYEKMARAMRYYYKMNILEKVPHKRLHFRFGERILSKVLHPSSSKPFIDKNKVYHNMYNLTKRNLSAVYTSNSMLKPNSNIASEFRKGHDLNYLSMQTERGKNTITYHPVDISPHGMTLPSYFNDHGNARLHHNLPHIVANAIPDIMPSREFTQKTIESEEFPCDMPQKLIPNSLDTSPGSNPSVSPYSGEETPETWSDVDSNDELIVDTDNSE